MAIKSFFSSEARAAARHQSRGTSIESTERARAFAGLDFLTSAVVILDADARVEHANAAAETLFEFSRKSLVSQRFSGLFLNGHVIEELFAEALEHQFSNKRLDLSLQRTHREPLHLHAIVTVWQDEPTTPVVLEMQEIDQQLKFDREERILDQSQANRELIRNLAHEIKNPLGGIRGAAQLLELELNAPEFREYTQVIIKEADRLQTLVDRLLAPHRRPHIVGEVNIHEVCERVRSVLLAEYPRGLAIERDYDTSIPEFRGDKEQLIQALLNIAHNGAQALREQIEAGTAEILLKTRIARQVTLAKIRYRLALELHVIDNGPGIPEDIKERIFFPLVSGREGGSGLGLTLAQTFIQQHHGLIECESRPGKTDFRIFLPLP
ncbi:MAG: nitrogen regulation protein NR(II) [Burkholderiaceae bacterium]|jgi:two-component system nitrogen regulation sensor histidine kinase GlnL